MANNVSIGYINNTVWARQSGFAGNININGTDLSRSPYAFFDAGGYGGLINVNPWAGYVAAGTNMRGAYLAYALQQYSAEACRIRTVQFTQAYNSFGNGNPTPQVPDYFRTAGCYPGQPYTSPYANYGYPDYNGSFPAGGVAWQANFDAVMNDISNRVVAYMGVVQAVVSYCHSNCHSNCHNSRGRR